MVPCANSFGSDSVVADQRYVIYPPKSESLVLQTLRRRRCHTPGHACATNHEISVLPEVCGKDIANSRARARVQKPCAKPYARVQGFSDMGRYMLAPVSYEALDHASGFASEQCPEGFCAVARNTLRILTVERLGETFNQQARPNPPTPTRT